MQWRSKVRSQQHVQEKEADEQALRMKELQQLVVTERMAKEQLETQVVTSPLSYYITYHQCLLQISSCLQLACLALLCLQISSVLAADIILLAACLLCLQISSVLAALTFYLEGCFILRE